MAKDEATLTKAFDAVRKQDVKGFRAVLERPACCASASSSADSSATGTASASASSSAASSRDRPEIPQLREFALALEAGQDEARSRAERGVRRARTTRLGGCHRRVEARPLLLLRLSVDLLHALRAVLLVLCPPGCLTTFRYIGGYNILTAINAGQWPDDRTTRVLPDDPPERRPVQAAQRRAGRIPLRIHGASGRCVDTSADGLDRARRTSGQWQSTVPAPPDDVKPYAVKGTAPNDMVATLTADGWVQVPQESNVNDAGGNFAPNGNLSSSTRRRWRPGPTSPSRHTAGQSTTPAGSARTSSSGCGCASDEWACPRPK